MPNKMERFTQRARRVLSIAQEEAERLRHNAIDTEHMLMGLLHEEGGVAGRVLRDLAVEQKRIEEILTQSPQSDAPSSSKMTDLTAGCKRVLELAVDEARRMGHHYIGTEHLLLGMVRQEDSTAVRILKQLNVTPEEVRQQTRRVLQEIPTHDDVQPQMAAEPSSAVPEPKQAMKRLSADAYDLLENVLMKILNMIEADKLPVAQGVELFSTLAPDLKLAPGQQAELISHLFEQKKFNDYQVRLKAIDSKGVETLSETILPLTTLLGEIDHFLAVALNEPDTPLTFTLGDNILKLQIEKGKSNDVQ